MNKAVERVTLVRISVITIYVVAVFSPSACLYAQEGQVQATSTVVISEICFWPDEGESEWVELKNISPNSVDISGWQITNGRDFTFIFPDTLPLMPTQAHVLLKFDGQESALNDLLFDGDNLIVIHCPNKQFQDFIMANYERVEPIRAFLPHVVFRLKSKRDTK